MRISLDLLCGEQSQADTGHRVHYHYHKFPFWDMQICELNMHRRNASGKWPQPLFWHFKTRVFLYFFFFFRQRGTTVTGRKKNNHKRRKKTNIKTRELIQITSSYLIIILIKYNNKKISLPSCRAMEDYFFLDFFPQPSLASQRLRL